MTGKKDTLEYLKNFLIEHDALEEFKKAFNNSKQHHEEYASPKFSVSTAIDNCILWEENDEVIDWSELHDILYRRAHNSEYCLLTIDDIRVHIVDNSSIFKVFSIAKRGSA